MPRKTLALTLALLSLTYCSSLPVGQSGEAAEQLAQKMLKAANYDKWQATAAVSFTFRGDDKVFWDKKRKLVEVADKKNLVQFSEVTGKSICFEGDRRITDGCDTLTATALKKFYNHTYWINPAFHIMSPGAERSLVEDKTLNDAEAKKLLVGFKSGGSTPGDSYLFTLDAEGKIDNMRMWVSLKMIPNGAKAVFSDYKITETGVNVALHHKLMSIASVDLSDLKMYASYPESGKADRFQMLLEQPGALGADSLNRKK
jgi:hypothetical protein